MTVLIEIIKHKLSCLEMRSCLINKNKINFWYGTVLLKFDPVDIVGQSFF